MSLIRSETEAQQPRRWKWTGDDLVRLAGLGFLPPEQRFELMAGEIIEIMPPSPLHAAVVALLAELLGELLGPGFHVREEKPVRLGTHYEPQPDLAVVRGAPLDYVKRFPDPADVVFLVEVADSSLEYDQSQKLRAYAAAGVQEYWIVNLRDQILEVYRDPSGETYRTVNHCRAGEAVPVTGRSAVALEVSALFAGE